MKSEDWLDDSTALNKAGILEFLERPQGCIRRIVEEIDITGSCVRRRISFDLTVPRVGFDAEDEERHLHIPLLFVRKGELLDNLDVTDASSNSLPTLGHRQHQELAATLLHTAVLEEFSSQRKSRLVWRDSRATESWTADLCAIPLVDSEIAEEIFQSIFYPARPHLDPVARTISLSKRLRRLSSFFVRNYVLAVTMFAVAGEEILVKVSHDLPHNDAAFITEAMPQAVKIGFRRRGIAAIKRFLGQRPVAFRILLPLARQSESYHLRMPAPSGHYVHRQRLLAANRAKPKDTLEDASAKSKRPEYVLSSLPLGPRGIRSGDEKRRGSYVHLYLHDLFPIGPQPIVARIAFFENPPTAIMLAAVLATVGTVPTFLIALLLNRWIAASFLDTDLPALSLALPGVVALWVRSPQDTADVLRTSLLSRTSGGIVGFFFFLCSMLLLVCRLRIPTSEHAVLATRVMWWGLFLANVAIATWFWVRSVKAWRTWAYDTTSPDWMLQ